MFRVLDLTPSGQLEETEGIERVAPPPDGVLRWVDLIETDDASLQVLAERFGFHPLAIEDCASFELHSKLEEYPDHLFVVLHAFTEDPADPFDIQIHEVHAFLNESYLVTVHDNPVPAAEHVWERAKNEPEMFRSTAWMLYRTADAMVDAIFPLMSKYHDEVERIESVVLTQPDDQELAQIFHLRSTLVSMRRVVRPMRDVVSMLTRRKHPPMTKRSAQYFRDIYDHVIRCNETIEETQGLVESAMDAYQSAISNRTNDIVTRLTIFSVIFLPLSFITGFFGQNFDDLPVHSAALYWTMLGVTLGLPVGLLIWFRRKGWL